MKVYDLSGRAVSTIIDQVMPAGYHSLSWNPQNTAVAGIYINFYKSVPHSCGFLFVGGWVEKHTRIAGRFFVI